MSSVFKPVSLVDVGRGERQALAEVSKHRALRVGCDEDEADTCFAIPHPEARLHSALLQAFSVETSVLVAAIANQ